MARHTTNPLTRYKNWHWGEEATTQVEWPDPDYPDTLIEIGRLTELHVKENPEVKGRPQIIRIPEDHADSSHLAFDADHPAQRLYVLTPEAVRRAARRTYYDADANMPLEALAQGVAEDVGATAAHASGYASNVNASPIGFLTHVVYLTHKKGDGVSLYIHELGENDKHAGKPVRLPLLVVDAQGRFWIVGGAYTCPVPGITN
jgi:hypothetical protein